MLRKFVIGFTTLLAVTCVYGAAFYVDSPRFAGSNTLSGSQYWFAVDSTDTHMVDTVYSDTVTLDSLAKWMNISIKMLGYTMCDSCNDSMNIVVHGITAHEGRMKTTIFTDTIPTTLGTLDSTIELTKKIYLDSLVATQFWFETIVSDSVIIGNITPDSIRVELDYMVGHKAFVD